MRHSDSADETFLLSRRLVLTGSAMAAGALAAPALAAPNSGGAALAREQGLPADPAARVAMMRRMRLRTDAGLVFWWFRGRNYAQQGALLTPLCELVFGAVMKIAPLPGGEMEVTSYELGFRTPLGSSERSDTLRNPLTGERVDVPFAPVGPTTVRYDAENTPLLPTEIGGTKFTFEHVPELFYHIGDQVCFQTHGAALSQTPGLPPRRLNDMTMLCSPARQALDPRVRSATATGHGSDVSDFARWWKMPAGMGVQCLRSVGRKEASFAAMPRDWVEMLARVDPVGARDPHKLIAGPQQTYRN